MGKFTAALLLFLLLIGCGNNPSSSQLIDSDLDSQSMLEESQTNKDDQKNNTLSDERQITDSNETTSSDTSLSSTVSDSDYIIVLKMTQTGSSGRDFEINKEIKGSFKNIVVPEIDGLEPNRYYIVMMKDSINGDIILTNDDSLIEISSPTDAKVEEVSNFFN